MGGHPDGVLSGVGCEQECMGGMWRGGWPDVAAAEAARAGRNVHCHAHALTQQVP